MIYEFNENTTMAICYDRIVVPQRSSGGMRDEEVHIERTGEKKSGGHCATGMRRTRGDFRVTYI